MVKSNKMLTILLVLLMLSGLSFSQQSNHSLGFWGSGTLNMHTPSITVTTVPFKTNASFLNGAFGVNYNYFYNDMFTFSGRLGLNFLGADLDSGANTLKVSLMDLELTPAVQIYNLIPVNNLYLLGGIELGIPLSNSYQLNSAAANDLESLFRMGIALGVGYDIKINNNWKITPEVSYRLGLNKKVDASNTNYNGTIGVDQLRFGIAFNYQFGEEKTVEPVINNDPADLKVGFKDVKYYDNAGKSYPLEKIKLEDFQYTEQFPLVPYVFFDENVSTPNAKTTKLMQEPKSAEFTIESIEPDALIINTKTLDVVGQRLKDNKNAELTITGTNDNKTEKKTKNISTERAEFARDYIVKNFEVSPDRINIKAIGLPEKASSSNVQDGIEENRRIEFSSSNPKILEPILLQSENQRLADPNLIEFSPFAESKDSIVKWKLEVYQGSKLLRTFEGTDEVKPVQWVIYPNELMNKQVPVDYNFFAETNRGIKKSANGTVPTEYYSITRKKSEDLPDKTIAKYSLILFDFDKSDVSEKDMDIINESIIPAIKFNSIVKIYGYTDRIGDEKYNQKLATKRAETVKSILEAKVKSANYEVIGVGEGNFIYDNDLPTGRHLSRTVQVYVITPKQ